MLPRKPLTEQDGLPRRDTADPHIASHRRWPGRGIHSDQRGYDPTRAPQI